MRTEATVSINGAPEVPCTFAIEIAQIEVSTFGRSEPDMAWQVSDEAGHFHAFDHDGNLPTLKTKTEWVAYEEPDEDGETGYEVSTCHCLICDALIQPVWKYIPHTHREFAPGRTSYDLTVVGPVPDERFSVVVTVGDRVFFGVAEGSPVRLAGYEVSVPCGPMSWRKAAASTEGKEAA